MQDSAFRHLRSLTSLRFVAALLVVVFHLSLFVPGLDPVGRLVAVGYVGVTFFFVLSGFVLTYSWSADPRATRFYRRRFARIYPLHLLFIAVAMLPVNPPPNWPALPANLALVQSWSPDDAVARSFSGVSWSLSCEMFFYAAFPLLVRWLWRVRRPMALAAALVGTALAVGVVLEVHDRELGDWLFHLPAFRIVEFACGALAAIAFMRGWTPPLRLRWAVASVAVSYLTVLCLPVLIGNRVEDRWALTLAMVPSVVLLIVACARVDIVGASSPLQSRTMVSLGDWSFCMYMTHPVVIWLTRPLLEEPSLAGALLGSLLVVLTVVGASYLLHATFERPLERWIRGGALRASSTLPVAVESMPAVVTDKTTSLGSPPNLATSD